MIYMYIFVTCYALCILKYIYKNNFVENLCRKNIWMSSFFL